MSTATRLLVILAVAAVLTVAGGVAVLRWLGTVDLLGTDTDAVTPAMAAGYGRIILPPSAADLHGHLTGFQDHLTFIRFTMDPADAPAFWTGTACATAPAVIDPPPATITTELGGLSRPWWTPTRATHARLRTFHGPYTQAILIDTTDPTRYTVYVRTMEF